MRTAWPYSLQLGSACCANADVVDLKREHQRALRARTLMGHMENLLGYILSLYCIYRCAAEAWYAHARHGMPRHGTAWRGIGMARRGIGMARHDMTATGHAIVLLWHEPS